MARKTVKDAPQKTVEKGKNGGWRPGAGRPKKAPEDRAQPWLDHINPKTGKPYSPATYWRAKKRGEL